MKLRYERHCFSQGKSGLGVPEHDGGDLLIALIRFISKDKLNHILLIEKKNWNLFSQNP